MSIEFKAAICPNCSGKIHFAEKADRTTCQYCGATIFIDRSKSKVWIGKKPIKLSLYKKLSKKVTNTGLAYTLEALGELMAKFDNKIFSPPKSEIRRFVEWMNQRDDITVTKREVPFGDIAFKFGTTGREHEYNDTYYAQLLKLRKRLEKNSP